MSSPFPSISMVLNVDWTWCARVATYRAGRHLGGCSDQFVTRRRGLRLGGHPDVITGRRTPGAVASWHRNPVWRPLVAFPRQLRQAMPPLRAPRPASRRGADHEEPPWKFRSLWATTAGTRRANCASARVQAMYAASDPGEALDRHSLREVDHDKWDSVGRWTDPVSRASVPCEQVIAW